MDLYLIRHTPVGLEPGICYGQSDVEPGPNFSREREDVKSRLPFLEGMVFYSSPLARCLELARFLSPGEVHVEPDLMELNFGSWELRPWDSIPRSELDPWAEDFVHARVPGGESYQDLLERSRSFYRRLLEGEAKAACVVTHGGVIRSLLALLLEIPLKNSFRLAIDPGGITHLVVENVSPDSVVVEFINR